ncbi:MAG: YeeE/YedE family protein, partial [Alsobacter sp.]
MSVIAPVPAPQRLPLLASIALVSALLVAAASHGWRLAALAGVGVLLGASLFHASFGFASGYRRLLVHGDGRGVLAQLLLLTLLTVLFAPILLSGAAKGAVAP